MTGNRALSCVFCRILRLIEINRRISSVKCLRVPAGVSCINTRRTFSTSPWLQDRSKDSEPGTGSSSSSESSSDGEYASSSSGSESDSERESAENSKEAEKPEAKPDLLTLLSKMKASENKWGPKQSVESNLKDIEHSIDSKLVSEAVKLSKELPGDKEKSESDLVGRLLSQFETTAKQRKGAVPIETPSKAKGLSAIMEGLSVEKEIRKHSDKGVKGSYKIEEYEEGHEKPLLFRQGGSDLFEGRPLGIFTPEDMKSEHTEKKSLFEMVEEEDKNQLQFFPPQNAFEEQIQWTKEGKLWTFPIDNEAGWEEELNVEFYEHVFLENQMQDFPKKGPIRHFMELVTTALSKNPYLTVAQKHEHIDWYKNYFHGKQDMLEARLGRDGVIQAEA